MTPLSKNARVAGFLYLLLSMVGPIRLIYIPSTLIVHGNAAATANNIATHEWLFRCGIVSDLLTGFLSLLVGLALYRLFKVVDQTYATLIVIFGSLMVAPIYFVNTVNDAAALFLARGADFLSAIDKPQRDALAMLFLRLHDHGVLANEIFWGVWLLPFGILVYKSRFLPRFLGVWLIVNCFAYLATSFTGLLAPQYEQTVANYAFPVMFGEVAIMLWLLIMGAKEPTLGVGTSPSAAQ
jgi:hypothetical protein